MPVMDEFREERESIKNASFQEKRKYFWYYYKWHTIGAILLIGCLISLAHSILSDKEDALFVSMLNCSDIAGPAEEFNAAFAEYANIDLHQYDLTFDTNVFMDFNAYDEGSMATIQKMSIYTTSGELDVLMGGGDVFAHYANGRMFYDMRELLSQEQIAKYEPYFYYIDLDTVQELDRLAAHLEDSDQVTIPDPRKPEEMGNPVPVALLIDNDKISDAYYFRNVEEGLALGVFVNSSRVDTALKFIDYLMTL